MEQLATTEKLANVLNDRMKNRKGGNNQRLALMLGMLTKDQQIKANIPKKDRSQFAQVKWKFLLEAPFEVSNRCCHVMKKSPMHTYSRKTGKYAITAQMASESRLRTQKWIQFGCNMFDASIPISNPMSFWFEQDVLLYAKLNNIKLCSVYGDIVTEDGSEFNPEGQMDLAIFDEERIGLKTTGCNRTGCCMCGFGVHLEKRPNRLEMIEQFSKQSIQDYILRGGGFDEDGLWKPMNGGLGYWFILQYLNVHGNTKIYIPNYEKYEREYGNEMTKKYLQ